jgi:DNA-binding response OmpR family regulator
MEAARVLFVGRTRSKDGSSLAAALERRHQVTLATSGKEAIDLAHAQASAVIILDADSMRTPGDRICQQLRDHLPHIPIIHIHPGPKDLAQSVADVLLIVPVTAVRLRKAVERLIQPRSEDNLTCGPFTMSLNRRVLVVNGQETQLTPKQALLTETLLRHPDEILDRKTLMEKVWDTDYMGDTRTLDVHIRWIRQVIEPDPGKPTYLQTVRGVGYRLSLPNGTKLD